MLVIVAGLPGAGKSTLAQAAAARVHGAVLDKDQIRAALFAPADVEYSAAQDDFVMELMLETAAYLLRKDPLRIVFLDGRTFSQAYQRMRAIEFAQKLGTPWRVIECVCSEATAKKRLEQDRRTGRHPAANRTWELYERVRASFEAIEQPKIVINTDGDFSSCVDEAVRGMAG